ncbi:MAG: hypothetical protein QXP34_03770 [Candidatus Aenigmatarchaeota archaeon]
MVKVPRIKKLSELKESRDLKRFLTTIILTIALSLIYFNLFKLLETPKIKEINRFEISNAFIWIDDITKIRNNSYFYIEKTYEYSISYPYVIRKSYYCYDLPKDFKYFTKNYEELQVSFIDNKVCLSSQIESFIAKSYEIRKDFSFVRIMKSENVYKIYIKNFYNFPMNLDLRIDVEKLVGNKASVYRENILISENVSIFFDSKVIAPYSSIEYEIK